MTLYLLVCALICVKCSELTGSSRVEIFKSDPAASFEAVPQIYTAEQDSKYFRRHRSLAAHEKNLTGLRELLRQLRENTKNKNAEKAGTETMNTEGKP